jgi:hypothetical protein
MNPADFLELVKFIRTAIPVFVLLWNIAIVLIRLGVPALNTFILASWLLFMCGWVGLYILFDTTIPANWQPLWVFFFLTVLAITGTVLPVIAFLNRRFPATPPASSGVILREALWFGVYMPTLAWLQIGRVLTPLLVFLLAAGFVLIEFLLRLREKSLWKPETEIREA